MAQGLNMSVLRTVNVIIRPYNRVFVTMVKFSFYWFARIHPHHGKTAPKRVPHPFCLFENISVDIT